MPVHGTPTTCAGCEALYAERKDLDSIRQIIEWGKRLDAHIKEQH